MEEEVVGSALLVTGTPQQHVEEECVLKSR